MTETWLRARHAALDSVRALEAILADEDVDERRLIVAYLESKHRLADAFELLAVSHYADPAILRECKSQIELTMQERYRLIPDKYLRVRGYGTAHALLLAYLVQTIGVEVSAAELRILTGDAVHTERRTRELRELGLALDARHTAGRSVYVLKSAQADVMFGAATQLAKNIRKDEGLSTLERDQLLKSVGLA